MRNRVNEGETLRALVSRMLAEHDMSGREFARKAGDRGYNVSYTTVNSIANGTRRHATDETLRAIAEVFGLPENDVRGAAGVTPRDDSTDPQLLALHAQLSPEEKEQAVRMYREYVRTLRALRTPADRKP